MVAFGQGQETDVVFPDHVARWGSAPFAESR
jgi:hypothetical protein